MTKIGIPNLIFVILTLIPFAVYSCEKSNILPEQKTPTDTLYYQIYLLINYNGIAEMKRYRDGDIQEKIVFEYTDKKVIKSTYAKDSLYRKSVYHINELHHADSSMDSIFHDELYFKTFYEYNEQNYLIKETHIPGVFSYFDITDLTSYTYSVTSGNRITTGYQPSSSAQGTNFHRYEYSTHPMTYDIIEYNNNILGRQNTNLPESYGIEMIVPKEGFAGGYTPIYKIDYLIEEGLVLTRFDTRIVGDSIKKITRFDYEYHHE